jgi:hypothetical protein
MPVVRDPMNLDLSDQEAESDQEADKIEDIVVDDALPIQLARPHGEIVLSSSKAASSPSSSGSSSSLGVAKMRKIQLEMKPLLIE